MTDVNNFITTLIEKTDNVVFLNNSHYDIDNDCVVIGTTLWSQIGDNIRYPGMDQQIIYRESQLQCRDINNIHTTSVNYIESKLHTLSNKKIILITHHLPSYQLISPKFKKSHTLSRWATNLDYLLKPPIVGWLCGHSHIRVEKRIGSVYCGINACPREIESRCFEIRYP